MSEHKYGWESWTPGMVEAPKQTKYDWEKWTPEKKVSTPIVEEKTITPKREETVIPKQEKPKGESVYDAVFKPKEDVPVAFEIPEYSLPTKQELTISAPSPNLPETSQGKILAPKDLPLQTRMSMGLNKAIDSIGKNIKAFTYGVGEKAGGDVLARTFEHMIGNEVKPRTTEEKERQLITNLNLKPDVSPDKSLQVAHGIGQTASNIGTMIGLGSLGIHPAGIGAITGAKRAYEEGQGIGGMAKESARSATFMSVGDLASKGAGIGLQKIIDPIIKKNPTWLTSPAISKTIQAAVEGVKGASFAIGGTLASVPLYSKEERPTTGETIKRAVEMGLFSIGMSVLTGAKYIPKDHILQGGTKTIYKTAKELKKEGYTEYKTGIWVLRDKNGMLLDQQYEGITIDGASIPRYILATAERQLGHKLSKAERTQLVNEYLNRVKPTTDTVTAQPKTQPAEATTKEVLALGEGKPAIIDTVKPESITTPVTTISDKQIEPPMTEVTDTQKTDVAVTTEEPKENIGYHYGDLGKSDFLASMPGRGTGHFGTGTYFFGSTDAPGAKGYAEKGRPLNIASFDGYNLYIPKGAEEGKKLHDFLKDINKFAFGSPRYRSSLKDVIKTGKELFPDITTEHILKEIRSLRRYANENMEKDIEARFDKAPRFDSPSTVFMKNLGYDGVDVRGIKGLDDSEFGSVIYNLKAESSVDEPKKIARKEFAEEVENITEPSDEDVRLEIKRINKRIAELSEGKENRVKSGEIVHLEQKRNALLKRFESPIKEPKTNAAKLANALADQKLELGNMKLTAPTSTRHGFDGLQREQIAQELIDGSKTKKERINIKVKGDGELDIVNNNSVIATVLDEIGFKPQEVKLPYKLAVNAKDTIYVDDKRKAVSPNGYYVAYITDAEMSSLKEYAQSKEKLIKPFDATKSPIATEGGKLVKLSETPKLQKLDKRAHYVFRVNDELYVVDKKYFDIFNNDGNEFYVAPKAPSPFFVKNGNKDIGLVMPIRPSENLKEKYENLNPATGRDFFSKPKSARKSSTSKTKGKQQPAKSKPVVNKKDGESVVSEGKATLYTPEQRGTDIGKAKTEKKDKVIGVDEHVKVLSSPETKKSFERAVEYLKEKDLLDGDIKLSEPKTDMQRAYQDIMKAFGQKVVYFEAEGEYVIGGMIDQENPDYLFINNEDDVSIPSAIGHEFMHSLENKHSDLYDQLYNIIAPTITKRQQREYLEENYGDMGEYYDWLKENPELLIAEMIADEAGNSFTDKSFWEKLYEHSKELFEKVVKLFKQFLDKLKGEQFENTFTNTQIEVFQDEFQKVLTEVRNRITSGAIVGGKSVGDIKLSAISTQIKLPAFKKWFGDSKVVDKEGKPLIVYHGTGATFNAFDPLFAGHGTDQYGSGFYFTSDKEIAKGYAIEKSAGDSKVIDAFLSIKKPITIDGNKESSLKNVSVSQLQAYKIIRQAPNIMNKPDSEVPSPLGDFHEKYWETGATDFMIHNVSKNYVNNIVAIENDFFRDNSEAFRKAVNKVMGYDGVIINFKDGTQHFVAWFPNQIKSATSNAGTFDSASPDIRLSARERLGKKSLLYEGQPLFSVRRRDAGQRLTAGKQGETLAMSSPKHNELEQKIKESNKEKNFTEPTSRKEIVDFLQERLDIPIAHGKFRQRALGIFKTKPEVIRLKDEYDLETLFHETGHFLDKKLSLTDSRFGSELIELGLPTSRRSYSKEKIMNEGVAEFVRLYSLGLDDELKQKSPRFYSYFRTKIAQNKDFDDMLFTVRSAVDNYTTQDPEQRILGQISIGKRDVGRKLTKERLYTAWFDNLHSLELTVNHITGGAELPASQNPYILARLRAGTAGRAEAMLKWGAIDGVTVDEKGFKIISKSFEEIIEPVKDELNSLRAYGVAKRAIELHERNIKTGIRIQDAKEIYQRHKGSIYDDVLDDLQEYQGGLLEYLAKAEMLSNKQVNNFKKLNKQYLPFFRVIESFNNKGKGTSGVPIKGIKGSDKIIIDPLESIIKNTFLFVDLAERNRVNKALVDLANMYEGWGKIMDKVPPKMIGRSFSLKEIEKAILDAGGDTEGIDLETFATIFRPTGYTNKDNIITVFQQGEPTYYEIFDEDLYRTLMQLDKQSTNFLMEIASIPAQVLRAGATLSPDFMARNPIRDAFFASVVSEYGFIPGLDTVKGLMHVVKKDDVYKQWMYSGGAQSAMVSFDRDYLQKTMRSLLEKSFKDKKRAFIELPVKDKALHIINSPLEALRVLSEFSEEPTRVRTFEKGVRKESKKEGMLTLDALLTGAFYSREGSVDFARGGNISKSVNKIDAFFNASLQGTDAFVRVMKKHPKRTLLRCLLYITLPSIVLWAKNAKDKRYQELQQWQKDTYWIVPTANMLFAFPKPFEPGILFGSFVERMLDSIIKENPDAYDGLVRQITQNLTPDIVPTALAPWVEVLTNYDMFRGREVVPQGEQKLEPSEQYGKYTSEFAKLIGKQLNISPRKIDHVLYGYGAGLARYGTSVIDAVLDGLGIVDKTTAPEKPAHATLPFIKGLTIEPFQNSASVDKFYKNLNELETEHATTRRKAKYPDSVKAPSELAKLRKVSRELADIRKEIDNVYSSETLSAKAKKLRLDNLNLRYINKAREALGDKPITKADF